MSKESAAEQGKSSWSWDWTTKITQVAKESFVTAAEVTKNYAEVTKTLINDLANEESPNDPATQACLPWHLPLELKHKEELVKRQILLLSEEKWSFLTMPQNSEQILADWDYQFDPDIAQALMKADPKLDRMRFLLVPYKVKEDPFWKNYFARVFIIKSTIMDPSVTIPSLSKPPTEEKKPQVDPFDEQMKKLAVSSTSPSISKVNKTTADDIKAISREEELKKELEELGEFDLDLELELNLDPESDFADLDFDDQELELLLNE